MDLRETIGANIRAARESARMTQQELAVRMGLESHSAISEIESGKRRVEAQHLARLSQVFGRTVDWFFDPESTREDFVALARAQGSGASVQEALRAAQRLVENFVFLRRILRK